MRPSVLGALSMMEPGTRMYIKNFRLKVSSCQRISLVVMIKWFRDVVVIIIGSDLPEIRFTRVRIAARPSFFVLCTLGFPCPALRKIWKFLIGCTSEHTPFSAMSVLLNSPSTSWYHITPFPRIGEGLHFVLCTNACSSSGSGFDS